MIKLKQIEKAALAINIAIILLEIAGFCHSIPVLGWWNLIYYTEDSNAMMLIASIVYSIYLIHHIKNPKFKLPSWLQALKYMATLSVAVTLLVALTILPWSMHVSLWTLLTSGSMLYHHTLCPILALVSFVFLEKYQLKSATKIAQALIFTLVYATIMIPLNIAKLVVGPYPFLMVYKQPIWASILWVVVIMGGAFGLAKIIAICNQKFSKAS